MNDLYICRKCKNIKKESDFTRWHFKDHQSKCNECRAKLAKQLYFLKKRYKIPKIGFCDICNHKKELRFDHKKLKFRGALCNYCNTFLGRCGDSLQGVSERFLKIKKYLSNNYTKKYLIKENI